MFSKAQGAGSFRGSQIRYACTSILKPDQELTDASLEAGQQQKEQLWARESDELAAGSLSLYLGCMFAGKSSLLIDTLSQAEASFAL